MTIFYIIWFTFLSFVFRLCLYLSVSLSCLHISNTHTISLPTLWIFSAFCTSNKKNFSYLYHFFFCHLFLLLKHYTNLYSLISTISTLSLPLYLSYLYNIKEKVTNTEWQRVTKPKSQKAKKPKKKKKKKKNTTGIDSIHNHQFSSSLINKNTNTTSPQAQIIRFWDSQILY